LAVSEEEVRSLARLACLDLSDAEVASMTGHLTRLLGYVALIQRIDVEGSPETTHAGDAGLPLREDVARPGYPRAAMTAGAPAAQAGLFEVPRVITSRGARPASAASDDADDEVAP
jgi:aspartyl-tRNA(Asn)/glutamyl-tRNA(Gln) amidotransferase subunit C